MTDRQSVSEALDCYVPTAFEVACGWLHGELGDAVVTSRSDRSPAEALRDAVRSDLLTGTCLVPFSGGRDSSLVLAVACDVARQAGVDLPTAFTFRHPGQPEADETAWQELVMAHLAELGLRPAWQIRDVTVELDVVGPLVAPLLSKSGHPLWPPNLGAVIALAQTLPGGTVLSGEHGDTVLGLRRATLLAGTARRRGKGLSLTDWRAVADAALPRGVRAAWTRLGGWAPPWLTPVAQRRWRGLAARDTVQDPLRWDRSIRRATATRAAVTGMATIDSVSRTWGTRFASPLGDHEVIGALAGQGGWPGLASRGAMTRLLGGHLLPERLYSRHTKANFTASRFHDHTRATIAGWSGAGVDHQWVDVPALRAAWSVEQVHPQMGGLVQAAWLAQQGIDR